MPSRLEGTTSVEKDQILMRQRLDPLWKCLQVD